MSLTKIVQKIRAGRRFLISTHVNPDPDALASELALAIFLRKMGKTVFVVNEDTIPARFKFLPRSQLITKMNQSKMRLPSENSLLILRTKPLQLILER